MAIPNKVLPGFAATMYMQPLASPTPLATSALSTVASVSAIAIAANAIPLENIPAFGTDDAVASYGIAGSRSGDKIPVQNAPTSMSLTAAWNPSDANLLLIRGDAYSGVVDRTYVIAATDGANTQYYAFNGRVGNFQIDSSVGAEAKCMFTIHPRGNQYGWSNNV